jgi:hypothetical protein
MTAPRPEVLLGDIDREQMPLELATDGVLRYVWQSAFGPILIEVREGQAFVNGQQVTPIAEIDRLGESSVRPGSPLPSLTLVGRE